MKAGKLRQVVTIQALGDEVQDSAGQPSQGWEDVIAVRADVEPLSGREYFNAQQLLSEVTARITIRYLPGITTANRLVFGASNYDILDIIDVDSRHRELQLMCRTGLVDNA